MSHSSANLRPGRRFQALAFGLLWLGMFINGAAMASPRVEAVRVGGDADRVRVVLDLTDRLPHRIFPLADPYRIVLDLPRVNWSLEGATLPAETGGINRYRYGHFRDDTSRLVFDLDRPLQVDGTLELPPGGGFGPRLVIDLSPVTEEGFRRQVAASQALQSMNRPPSEGTHQQIATRTKAATAALPVPTAKLNPAPEPTAAAATGGRISLPFPELKPQFLPRKRVVVIDPGHGGNDPGAISRSGIHEKQLALDYSREIRRVLEETGRYKVFLTRERDEFLRLRSRTAKARQYGAELFLSVHADTIGRSDLRGASVYTLSEKASDAEAAALAERENKADILNGIDLNKEADDVSTILIDLAQRETMNQSKRFARDLLKSVGKVAPLVNRSHRSAGFAVLKSPDIPAALLELGFLSSRADESRLTSPSHRRQIAEAVLEAVDTYFTRLVALNEE